MIDYNIRINLQGERTQYENITFTAGDSRGYCLRFAFYSYGARLDATGYTLAVKAKRADGQVIVDSGVTDEDGACYVVADNAISVAGDLELEVALLGSDTSLVTTAVICCYVRDGFGDGDLSAENTSPVLATLTQQAIQAAESASRAEAAVAEVKEETQTTVDEAVEESKTYADTVAEGAVQTVRNEAANAFIGAASGAAVRFDDVSPVGHELGVSVRSKNLIKRGDLFVSEAANGKNGVTFTDNGDGTVTVNGTPSEGNVVFSVWKVYLPAGVYTLSGAPDGALYSTYNMYLSGFNSAATADTPRTYTVTEEKTYYIVIQVLNGAVCDNVIFKPQLELGTVATEFVPYADVSGAHVLCCGRNLVHYSMEEVCKNYADMQDNGDGSYIRRGVTFTDNGDGSITANGTVTADGDLWIRLQMCTLSPGVYTLSGCPTGGNWKSYLLRLSISSNGDYGNGRIYTLDSTASCYVELFLYRGTTVENLTFKPQLEVGSVATDFVQGSEPISYAVNEDGSVSGVMSLSPDMTLMTDTEGLVADCTYHRDSNAVYEELVSAILSLGGNV